MGFCLVEAAFALNLFLIAMVFTVSTCVELKIKRSMLAKQNTMRQILVANIMLEQHGEPLLVGEDYILEFTAEMYCIIYDLPTKEQMRDCLEP